MGEMDLDPDFGSEAPEADMIEQRAAVREGAGTEIARPVPFDADEADAVEQRTPVREDEPGGDLPRPVPFDADEADAADQRRSVVHDDDDYR